MAIAFDTSGNNRDAGQTNTIALTVAAGSNKALVALTVVRDDGTEDVSGITWNTTENFTEVSSVADNDVVVQAWYLVNPTSASDDVVATATADPFAQCMAVISLTGVNQADPVPTDATGDNDDWGADWSIDITTQHANSWLFGSVCTRNANLDLTEDYTLVSSIDDNPSLWSQRRAVVGTGLYALTWTGSGNADAGLNILEIREAAAAAAGITVLSSAYILKSKQEQDGEHIPGLI